MSGRKLRYLGLGLVTTAGEGVLALTSMMNSAFAYGDDIGLVIGGSELPISTSRKAVVSVAARRAGVQSSP
jgi:hypothetical protein